MPPAGGQGDSSPQDGNEVEIFKRIKVSEKESNKFSIFLKNQLTIQIFEIFDKMCDISKVFRIFSYFSRRFGQRFQKIYKYPFEGGFNGRIPPEASEISNILDNGNMLFLITY